MKFFQKVKEIRSKAGELHFQRYAIFETAYLSLYIHRIYKADEDKHLHNHPWNFLSMVLWGCYLSENQDRLERKGMLSWTEMSRHDVHKINQIVDGPVTTIFLTYGKREPWGYLVRGKIVKASIYRELKNKGTFDKL